TQSRSKDEPTVLLPRSTHQTTSAGDSSTSVPNRQIVRILSAYTLSGVRTTHLCPWPHSRSYRPHSPTGYRSPATFCSSSAACCRTPFNDPSALTTWPFVPAAAVLPAGLTPT